jgi:hypothetical protein
MHRPQFRLITKLEMVVVHRLKARLEKSTFCILFIFFKPNLAHNHHLRLLFSREIPYRSFLKTKKEQNLIVYGGNGE